MVIKPILQEDCIKFPIILNQIAAFFVLLHALRFKENWEQSEKITVSLKDSFKKVFTSLQWIKKSKIVILLFCIVMLSESLILQFLTLMQQYWKAIEIPILYFGIIGSGLAFCASMVPALGKYCFKRFKFKTNFSICFLNLIIAYSIIALVSPILEFYQLYYFIVPISALFISMDAIFMMLAKNRFELQYLVFKVCYHFLNTVSLACSILS